MLRSQSKIGAIFALLFLLVLPHSLPLNFPGEIGQINRLIDDTAWVSQKRDDVRFRLRRSRSNFSGSDTCKKIIDLLTSIIILFTLGLLSAMMKSNLAREGLLLKKQQRELSGTFISSIIPLIKIRSSNGYLQLDLGRSPYNPIAPRISVTFTASSLITTAHTIMGLTRKYGNVLGILVYAASCILSGFF